MYRYNREWSDVKELPQDDSVPIVAIRYSDEYNEVFNYFRAICKLEEFSERALKLCTHALRLNPYNYNVWSYRRRILKNLKHDARREICWIEEVIRENPKNLHAWEHRRLMANLNLSYCDATSELNLTESLLDIDPRNYHAWQHRQWTIQTHKFSICGLLTSELAFTEKLLMVDVRNNSAWNQRFFVIKQRGKIDFFLVKKEFAFAVEKMKLAFDNESTWNYIRGLISTFKDIKKLPDYQQMISFVENEFYEKKNLNRHLIAFMIDAKIEMVLEFCESNEMIHTQKILQLCNLMAEKFDPTRRHYWKFVYKKFYFDKIKQRHESTDTGGAKADVSWKEKIGKKVNDESDDTLVPSEYVIAKGKKKKIVMKKKENLEKATSIGTDLLFEIMNKYNRQ